MCVGLIGHPPFSGPPSLPGQLGLERPFLEQSFAVHIPIQSMSHLFKINNRKDPAVPLTPTLSLEVIS